jgi:hypothetical protein
VAFAALGAGSATGKRETEVVDEDFLEQGSSSCSGVFDLGQWSF